MAVPSAQNLVAYNGGQMTDLPEFTEASFDGTELFEVVAPGNVEEGINYSITSALLASLLGLIFSTPTIITDGATLGDPYEAQTTDYRVLIDKTVASDTYVEIGGGADRKNPIMVRDLAGNADVHPITVSFSGTVDGLVSPITINAPYGGWVFNPLEDGDWYLTSC